MKKLSLKKVTSRKRGPGQHYTIRYADELNAAQHQAVMHAGGPALIIAGAGTGKTRTLIYRVARLVEDGVDPRAILLLTFTRKAAGEMLRRATMLLDGRCEHVAGGTFHSFANQVLRRHAKHIKFDSSFSVLDQGDAQDVVNLLRAQVVGSRKKRFARKQTIHNIISAAMNRASSIEDIIHNDYPQFVEDTTEIEYLAEAYARYKVNHNLMDYDDLLFYLHKILQEVPAVREQVQRQYKHVLVDEYQDTNIPQHEIVVFLAGQQENVMAVGDDAQSIYSFRGANFANIMKFPQAFNKECTIIKLEENYRSTQPILDLSNAVMNAAVQKFDKELYTHRQAEDKPYLIKADNEEQQAEFVVSQVLEMREEGVELSDMAVLFRSSHHSSDVELYLNKANVPFQKFGGFKFFETAHIKDVIAHLRVLVNPRDAVSWNRILLLLEGIGPRRAGAIVDAVTEESATWSDVQRFKALAGNNTSVEELFGMLNKLNRKRVGVDECVATVVDFYWPTLKRKYDDHQKRSRDIEMFQTIAERYADLDELLADMALEAPVESLEDVSATNDEDESLLTLSTIHSAKGLEWRVVFVIWVLDGRFPPVRSFKSTEDLEEERRLFYVACTRAADHLFMSYPMNIYDRETGMVLGRPSRFIEALDQELYDEYTLEFNDDE